MGICLLCGERGRVPLPHYSGMCLFCPVCIGLLHLHALNSPHLLTCTVYHVVFGRIIKLFRSHCTMYLFVYVRLPFLAPSCSSRYLHVFAISVDNSEWMRNGDFIPSRLQAQQDAVNVVCRMKTRQNVENGVALMSLAE